MGSSFIHLIRTLLLGWSDSMDISSNFLGESVMVVVGGLAVNTQTSLINPPAVWHPVLKRV